MAKAPVISHIARKSNPALSGKYPHPAKSAKLMPKRQANPGPHPALRF
jgi:hypothetical protein